jgi:arginyl-tRNA synthetase
MNEFPLTQANDTSQAARQGQDILNTILKCFDVPYIERVAQKSVRFGAYRKKENSLTLDGDFPRLVLDLRDPERLLGHTFWHIAHNYSEVDANKREAVEAHWNAVARKSLNCESLSITGYQETLSHISITFDLRNTDHDMLKAIEMVLALTHLEVKGIHKEPKVLH